MSGSTPLGIVYPCSGEQITPAVFTTYANTTQAAIATARAAANTARLPPAIQVRRLVQQNYNAGVNTGLTWDTLAYNTDPTGITFTLGTGTVNLLRNGTYLIGAHLRVGSQPANMTSMRIAILAAGVELAQFKSDSGATAGTTNTEVACSGLLIQVAAPVAITVNSIYTGAASPVGVTSLLSIIRVATV